MRDTGTRPIRSLQIIDSLGMGGAETWLMELLRYWSLKGTVSLDFLLTGGVPAVFDSEAQSLGAGLLYARYGRTHVQRFTSDYRKALRQGQYDAVHDHCDYASGWHFLLGAGVLPPVRVTHVHNPRLHIEANYATSNMRRMTTFLGRQLVERLATHVCGTSDDVLRRYGFIPGRAMRPRISVAYCGLNATTFGAPREPDRGSVLAEFNWPDDAKVVLFAGRLDRSLEIDHPQNHKNSWFALNVARAAVERHRSVRLLMAGSGDESRSKLERCIQAWGLRQELRLVGVRSDMPRLMRAADVLLFPSRQEGLGMVAVEAQAAGLPVITSTAVPSEARVIHDIYHALDLKQPIGVWADKLLDVMSRPRLSPASCRAALENSEFSIAKSARRLEEIYGWKGR
jgi:glycosyltransferase involved in cell wall biosynthesis